MSELVVEYNALRQEVLDRILEIIEPVDFEKKANEYNPERYKKLKSNDYIVLVIDLLLHKVDEIGLGLQILNGNPFVFNGQYWVLQDRARFKRFLGDVAHKMGLYKTLSKHFHFQDELFKQFISAVKAPLRQSKAATLINLLNGTIEVSQDGISFKTFSRDDHLTYQLPFKYEEGALCPKFLSFLKKVLPDPSLQDVLLEFLGYVLAPHLKLEKCLLQYGQGANGKSVVFDITYALFGKENVASYSLGDLNQEYNRAQVANKLVNFGSDIKSTMDLEYIKLMVSGEKIQARFKYGNSFLIDRFPKLMFNCNELPRQVEHTDAFFRRFLIIPYNITIPENERVSNLAEEIIHTELPGIFNLVLLGLKRLLANKSFTESEAASNAMKEYRHESDSISLFLQEERFTPSNVSYVLSKHIYERYKRFCIRDGYKWLSKCRFNKRLSHMGFVIERKNIGIVVYIQNQSDEK